MAGLTNFSAATDIVIAAQGWDMAAWAERVRAADPGRRVSIAPEVPSPGEIAWCSSGSSPRTGRIVFLGKAIDGRSFKQMRPLRKEMQVVFQDPYGSLSPRMSVADIVGEELKVHARTISAAERDAGGAGADRSGARHEGAGANGRPFARPAEEAEPRLPVHQPRPQGGEGAGRRHYRDAGGESCGERAGGRCIFGARDRLYSALMAAAFDIAAAPEGVVAD